jgi:HAD superfamily hydrolase (TIGR01459 family)
MVQLPQTIASLDEVTDRYSAILCDVWGVVHNGVSSFPSATAALMRARQRGLAVILITNAPRPNGDVERQLGTLAVPRESWDRMVTSGDVTRDLIRNGPRRVFHLGTDREMSIYDGIDVELSEENEAQVIVCTGLFDDETETPEDYAEMLRRFRSRDLPLICANPDIMVERGEKLAWCAGALARDYGQLGGRTLVSGKPHRPIYEAALEAASAVLGKPVSAEDALAIGDGILTDVKGADNNGIDVLYVSGGVHARDYGDPENPDGALLSEFLERHGHQPVAIIPKLR